jgi:hypothetical protein
MTGALPLRCAWVTGIALDVDPDRGNRLVCMCRFQDPQGFPDEEFFPSLAILLQSKW